MFFAMFMSIWLNHDKILASVVLTQCDLLVWLSTPFSFGLHGPEGGSSCRFIDAKYIIL